MASSIAAVRFRQVLIPGLAITLTLVGLMGFAHTASGRPLLRWIGRSGRASAACPLGYDRIASPADRFAIRLREAELHRDLPSVGDRRALDFRLVETTRGQVLTEMASQGSVCRESQSGTAGDLECEGPLRGARSSTLWLEFDEQDRLVSARGIERFASPREALRLFSELERSAGPRIVKQGRAEPDTLQAGLLSQVSASAEYRDYRFKARVTSFASDFAVTHEQIAF